MNVIGIGTDICDCARIAQMIEKHGDVFLKKVFTGNEIVYCSRHRASVPHFAGRWAAKEAILKALGTGWARGIQWTDLEIFHAAGGRPRVRLHGAAALISHEQGIAEILVSISHTATTAIAFATAVGESGKFPSGPQDPDCE